MEKKHIKIAKIEFLQKEYGVWPMQEAINSGEIWSMPHHRIHEAVVALNIGLCMFPKEQKVTPTGQLIPSRLQLRAGSAGSLLRCQLFWEKQYVVHFNMN